MSFYNLNPKDLESEDEKVWETILGKTYFYQEILMADKKILIAHIKFPDNFKKAINNPTEKTKKAADFYPDWFRMCCNLKYLFSKLEEEGLRLFKLFSSLSVKYNEKDCEKFWKKCKPKYGSIPFVFSIIDKYKDPEVKITSRREKFLEKMKGREPTLPQKILFMGLLTLITHCFLKHIEKLIIEKNKSFPFFFMWFAELYFFIFAVPYLITTL